MCGIVGFNQENAAKIERLTELLHHRGPDQCGYHVGKGMSLGHRRLSILDLSEHGRQPIYNEDKTICVVFNGEIFNFQDLKRQLTEHGHVFTSHTDTEVLVHGYEQWGTDLPKHLNGQFAFCIFDQTQNRLFLARDHFGIKPLYYYCVSDAFFFSSELKCFFRSSYHKEIDPLALDYYLLFGFMPTGRSVLKNVHQLLPGHSLLYSMDSHECKTETFWDWTFRKDKIYDEEEAIGQLQHLLEQSVKRQMISDVPLGAFLSGGIDSSILVSLMRKYTDTLKTFSIRFDHPAFNESHYAKLISEKCQTQHHEIEFNAQSVLKLIPKLAYHYDEPFADSSMIPTWLVSSVAREHVTVCLSGTGGDELFAGYRRYQEYPILRKLNHLPNIFKRLLDHVTGGCNVVLDSDKLNKLRVFLQDKQPDQVLYAMLLSYMFRDKKEKHNISSLVDRQDNYFCCQTELEGMLNYDTRVYLPDCLLVKEDRASMGHGLEIRIPFLDYQFAEYAFQLSNQLKQNGRQQKYILKKAFSHLLPQEILSRKKKGFGVPLVHYFRNELRNYAEDILFDSACRDYFDTSLLKTYWDRHQNGQSDYSRIFWSVIMFKLWHQEWMTSSAE